MIYAVGVCRPYKRHVTMTSQQQTSAWVEGVALFEDKVYVICDQSDLVTVYSLVGLHTVDVIKVGGLQLPNDLVCCCQSRRLYIADLTHCVWCVSVDDRRVKKWIPSKRAPEDFNPLSLSVTSSCKVLVTSYDGDALWLYTTDGILETRITLPALSKARHAVQTQDKTFVVCRTLPSHDVIEVDASGHVIRLSNAELNWPRRLALCAGGDVMVVDSGSGRVILLDGGLKLTRIMLSREHDGLRDPWRLCYTSDTGQLVIGDVSKIDSHRRIAVFNLI